SAFSSAPVYATWGADRVLAWASADTTVPSYCGSETPATGGPIDCAPVDLGGLVMSGPAAGSEASILRCSASPVTHSIPTIAKANTEAAAASRSRVILD